ncbi:MAG: hypothetical protein L6367_00025, partial [Cellulomonas sp.]|nr:hypothetical protein [Cellulomonas sp.]
MAGTLVPPPRHLTLEPTVTRRPAVHALRITGAGLALVSLAACSATNQVTTNQPYSLSDGVRVTLGPVTAVNLLVV